MRRRDAPTQNALPPDAVERFRRDLAALTGPLAEVKIGVAVSGGADSLALLLLADAALPGKVAAATVDHGLRPASAAEARFVADICAAHRIPHNTLAVAPPQRGNVSAWARTARYEALEKWRCAQQIDWVLTGHHADDQLETIIMRLNRGAGVGGLAGIRAVRGTVARPVLTWRRTELRAVVDHQGISPVDDPSNHDDRYDRARLRKQLARTDWLDAAAATRSAHALDQANHAIDWVIDAGLLPGVTLDPAGFVATALPEEIARRLVVRFVRRIDPLAEPRGPSLDTLIAALRDGKVATIGKVRCSGAGTHWTFTTAPPRRGTKA